MLIIFGLAVVSLMAVFAIVFVLPVVIVVAVVRARRRQVSAAAGAATDPDAAFAALVTHEWPSEAALFRRPDVPPG